MERDAMSHELQHEREARDLRLEIGRLRRRIDGRLRAVGREGRRLSSWRTYVRQFPACAVLTALGAGLVLSAGLSARRIGRWFGMRLVGRAFHLAGRTIWAELEEIWVRSTPDEQPAITGGGDDGRA